MTKSTGDLCGYNLGKYVFYLFMFVADKSAGGLADGRGDHRHLFPGCRDCPLPHLTAQFAMLGGCLPKVPWNRYSVHCLLLGQQHRVQENNKSSL